MNKEIKTKKSPESKGKLKSAARLAAVQSLYAIKIADHETKKLTKEFIEKVGNVNLGKISFNFNKDLYTDIVEKSIENKEEIIEKLNIISERNLNRHEKLIQCILIAGTYELLYSFKNDSNLIINEYVDITASFYDKKECGLINAILDKVLKV